MSDQTISESPTSSSPRRLLITIVILIIIAGGAFVYWYTQRDASTNSNIIQTASTNTNAANTNDAITTDDVDGLLNTATQTGIAADQTLNDLDDIDSTEDANLEL